MSLKVRFKNDTFSNRQKMEFLLIICAAFSMSFFHSCGKVGKLASSNNSELLTPESSTKLYDKVGLTCHLFVLSAAPTNDNGDVEDCACNFDALPDSAPEIFLPHKDGLFDSKKTRVIAIQEALTKIFKDLPSDDNKKNFFTSTNQIIITDTSKIFAFSRAKSLNLKNCMANLGITKSGVDANKIPTISSDPIAAMLNLDDLYRYVKDLSSPTFCSKPPLNLLGVNGCSCFPRENAIALKDSYSVYYPENKDINKAYLQKAYALNSKWGFCQKISNDFLGVWSNSYPGTDFGDYQKFAVEYYRRANELKKLTPVKPSKGCLYQAAYYSPTIKNSCTKYVVSNGELVELQDKTPNCLSEVKNLNWLLFLSVTDSNDPNKGNYAAADDCNCEFINKSECKNDVLCENDLQANIKEYFSKAYFGSSDACKDRINGVKAGGSIADLQGDQLNKAGFVPTTSTGNGGGNGSGGTDSNNTCLDKQYLFDSKPVCASNKISIIFSIYGSNGNMPTLQPAKDYPTTNFTSCKQNGSEKFFSPDLPKKTYNPDKVDSYKCVDVNSGNGGNGGGTPTGGTTGGTTNTTCGAKGPQTGTDACVADKSFLFDTPPSCDSSKITVSYTRDGVTSKMDTLVCNYVSCKTANGTKYFSLELPIKSYLNPNNNDHAEFMGCVPTAAVSSGTGVDKDGKCDGTKFLFDTKPDCASKKISVLLNKNGTIQPSVYPSTNVVSCKSNGVTKHFLSDMPNKGANDSMTSNSCVIVPTSSVAGATTDCPSAYQIFAKLPDQCASVDPIKFTLTDKEKNNFSTTIGKQNIYQCKVNDTPYNYSTSMVTFKIEATFSASCLGKDYTLSLYK